MEATAFVSPSKVPALADAPELAAELAPLSRHRVLRAGGQPQRRQTRNRGGAAVDRIRGVRRRRAQPRQRRPSQRRGDRADRGHRRDRPRRRRHRRGDHRHRMGLPVRRTDTPAAGAGHRRGGLRRRRRSARDRRHHRHHDPGRVSDLVGPVRPRIGDIPLGAHFHNTRGAGLASAYAAVAAGVTRLDASVGGLGGCPFAPAQAATSPPKTWCTCCGTAASGWTSTWTRRSPRPGSRRASSDTNCPARCCGPATGGL